MATESQVNFSKALAYIDKVKERLKDRPTDYAQFIDAMRVHHERKQMGEELNEEEAVQSTRARLADVFKQDPDLLEEFEQFVPENLKGAGRGMK